MFTWTIDSWKLGYSQFLKAELSEVGEEVLTDLTRICIPLNISCVCKNQAMHVSTYPNWPCSVLPHQYV